MRWQLAVFGMVVVAASVTAREIAFAETAYPSRPVQLISGFGAGSATDVTARILAQPLSDAMGQRFIVQDRPGAGSSVAAEQIARAPNDGYTIFLGTVANVINGLMQPDLRFDFEKDFAPVALVTSTPLVLVVQPSTGISSVKQLIERAKKEPGKIFFASSGVGTAPHLSGELFDMMTGVKMVHVPYQGSAQAVTDLLAGRTQVMFAPMSTVLPHIRAGKLKALAVTVAKRTSELPDVPTVDEAGVRGFETSLWIGFMVPKGTPRDVIEKLSAGVNKVLKEPATAAALTKAGLEVDGGSPAQFEAFMTAENKKWAAVVSAAGLSMKH